MFGAVEVLVPLQIADLGGGHVLIAGGFIAGAALEAVLAPIAGRYSDRAGRRMPFMVGLSICAVAMAAVAIGSIDGHGDGRPDPHLARRRDLLHAGADHALGGRREQPACTRASPRASPTWPGRRAR